MSDVVYDVQEQDDGFIVTWRGSRTPVGVVVFDKPVAHCKSGLAVDGEGDPIAEYERLESHAGLQRMRFAPYSGIWTLGTSPDIRGERL